MMDEMKEVEEIFKASDLSTELDVPNILTQAAYFLCGGPESEFRAYEVNGHHYLLGERGEVIDPTNIDGELSIPYENGRVVPNYPNEPQGVVLDLLNRVSGLMRDWSY